MRAWAATLETLEGEWAEEYGLEIDSLPRGVVVGSIELFDCRRRMARADSSGSCVGRCERRRLRKPDDSRSRFGLGRDDDSADSVPIAGHSRR